MAFAVGSAVVTRCAGARCPARLRLLERSVGRRSLDWCPFVPLSQREAQVRLHVFALLGQYGEPLQLLARRFREAGTRWGTLRNMAEVPLFVDSAASRLIQIADLLAWAVWRRYEYHDTRYFDGIVGRFDRDGGVIHGLVHRRAGAPGDCSCPACMSRSMRP